MTKIQPWSNFLDLCNQLCKCYLMTKIQPWSNFIDLCNQFCKCKMWSIFRHPWCFQRRQQSILCQIYAISLSKPRWYIYHDTIGMHVHSLFTSMFPKKRTTMLAQRAPKWYWEERMLEDIIIWSVVVSTMEDLCDISSKSQSHSTIGEPFIVRNVSFSTQKAPSDIEKRGC